MFDKVKDDSKPIVLYFVDKDNEETRKRISGQSVAEYSVEKAFFIIVEKVAKAAPPEKKERDVTGEARNRGDAREAVASKSPLPVDRLNAADRWEAYGVKTAGTLIVADWYGNPQTTLPNGSREASITRAIDMVPDSVKQIERKLEQDLAKAETAFEKEQGGKAMSAVLRVFKDGHYGYKAVNTAIERYNALMTTARARLSDLETEGDVSALRRLKMDYRGAGLDAEIDAAVARISGK